MFTPEDIIRATAARHCGAAPAITGVATDSRAVRPGDLFVALTGASFDGHAFVAAAARAGAAAALVARAMPVALPQFVVADTLAAYQELAAFHRSRFDVPVIAVTGSNGKTTVKEMIAAILRRCGRPVATEKNYNNHIGVPQTLLRLTPEHTQVVVEMGMNHPGEIARLALLARPTVGVITNIGSAHLEFFETQDAIAQAKLELLEGLPQGGAVVLPRDDAYFALLRAVALERRAARVVTFGADAGSDVSLAVAQADYSGVTGRLSTPAGAHEVRLQLVGAHNALNAAAAAAAVWALDPCIPLAEVAAGLESAVPAEMRCEVTWMNGIRVIVDCYNANPDSMSAALRLLAGNGHAGRRVALLGDMRELGAATRAAHERLGATAAASGLDRLIAVGEFADEVVRGAVQAGMARDAAQGFADGGAGAAAAFGYLKPGDVLLVKASRHLELERALDYHTRAAQQCAA